MPTPKQTSSPRRRAADDPLLRALRQVADDALEETVPDRLLGVLEAARRRQQAEQEGARERPDAPPKPDGPA